MISGIGTDIVDVKKVRRSLEKWGSRWAGKIFTESEIQKCESSPDPAASYAARFAAKESFFKAAPFSGIVFAPKEIETYMDDSGKPSINISGRYKELIDGGKRFHLSLAHEQDMATAVVIIEDYKTPL